MADQNDRYRVGHGKPPQANRFQKGSSGNPKGRPKGSKNLHKIVLKESQKKVHIEGPRGKQTLTMLEVVVKQMLQKAAKGDNRASRDFIGLVQQSEQAAASIGAVPSIGELDQSVLKNLHRRLAEFKQEEDSK